MNPVREELKREQYLQLSFCVNGPYQTLSFLWFNNVLENNMKLITGRNRVAQEKIKKQNPRLTGAAA
jgi:hypothetical protein